MRARLRQLRLSLNASYWFVPAMMTLAALLLAIGTTALDEYLGNGWVSNAWWMHLSKPDGARSLLSAIAGGMISVAGTVFSITIAAVVYASGSYGPRLLTNFMTDRGNQVSLGTFIATFVYALMTLRAIRQPDEAYGSGFVPELSLLIGIALALVSVGVLVFFLHHVPDSIRINNVVAGIGRRGLKEIAKRYPDERKNGVSDPKSPDDALRPITAQEPGYVQVIDFTGLRRIAEESDATIALSVRSGDFVHAGVEIARVGGDDLDGDALREFIAVGDDRTASQDVDYSLDELVEIALRALSPGINDPFTAITCFHWLGAATGALAARDLARAPDGEPYGAGRVFAVADDFAHFVRRGFGSTRTSAATNVIAARIWLESVEAVLLTTTDPKRRAALLQEVAAMMEQAREELTGPALADVEARHAQLEEKL